MAIHGLGVSERYNFRELYRVSYIYIHQIIYSRFYRGFYLRNNRIVYNYLPYWKIYSIEKRALISEVVKVVEFLRPMLIDFYVKGVIDFLNFVVSRRIFVKSRFFAVLVLTLAERL